MHNALYTWPVAAALREADKTLVHGWLQTQLRAISDGCRCQKSPVVFNWLGGLEAGKIPRSTERSSLKLGTDIVLSQNSEVMIEAETKIRKYRPSRLRLTQSYQSSISISISVCSKRRRNTDPYNGRRGALYRIQAGEHLCMSHPTLYGGWDKHFLGWCGRD